MKRTQLDKKERELKRSLKKETKLDSITRDHEMDKLSVSAGITNLLNLLQYDEDEIFNIQNNEPILELVFKLQESFTEKEIDNVFRKAIKKTKVKEKEKAFTELKGLLS